MDPGISAFLAMSIRHRHERGGKLSHTAKVIYAVVFILSLAAVVVGVAVDWA